MKVTKDIDIKMLKDMLGNMIEICKTSLKPKVELDYNTAIRIYDVLEETQIREERHQTLESACTFMEMEDGTQTNEMELHNKTDANGSILRDMKANSENKAPDCFRNYDDKCLECDNCEAKAGCAIATEEKEKEETKKKSCFGTFQNCYMCMHCIDCKMCSKETMRRKYKWW